MKSFACIFIAILAMLAPTQALLGAKLALFGVLRNSLEGGGGYGGGYGSGYGGGYGSGGGIGFNRPVYSGQSSNYGWGQQSYGGGYSSGFHGGYNTGYNGGSEDAVKVIKVIVNHEPPQGYYDNYARNSAASASAVSTSSAGSWNPIPAPVPVVQTYAAQPAHQPVQSVQVSSPSSVSVPVQVQSPAPTPVQVIQPPPRPIYVQAQPQHQYIQRPQSVYQQVSVQKPIPYSVQQPIYQQAQSAYQQPQQQIPQTIRVIVDGETQRAPAQNYGPANTYVAPNGDNAGAYNSDSLSISSSGSAANSISTGPWKSGSIWESVGC